MSRMVTFKQMQTALNEFGFEAQQHGGHTIFRHPKTGAVLTVPNMDRVVRPIYISTAARQIANSGIAATSAFEATLAKAARSTVVGPGSSARRHLARG